MGLFPEEAKQALAQMAADIKMMRQLLEQILAEVKSQKEQKT